MSTTTLDKAQSHGTGSSSDVSCHDSAVSIAALDLAQDPGTGSLSGVTCQAPASSLSGGVHRALVPGTGAFSNVACQDPALAGSSGIALDFVQAMPGTSRGAQGPDTVSMAGQDSALPVLSEGDLFPLGFNSTSGMMSHTGGSVSSAISSAASSQFGVGNIGSSSTAPTVNPATGFQAFNGQSAWWGGMPNVGGFNPNMVPHFPFVDPATGQVRMLPCTGFPAFSTAATPVTHSVPVVAHSSATVVVSTASNGSNQFHSSGTVVSSTGIGVAGIPGCLPTGEGISTTQVYANLGGREGFVSPSARRNIPAAAGSARDLLDDSSAMDAMDVDSDNHESILDYSDDRAGNPQCGGSYRRNVSAIAETSFRESLELVFDTLPGRLQKPAEVPDPRGYFSDDESPKARHPGNFLVLPLAGRSRHYMDTSCEMVKQVMDKKLQQAQRQTNFSIKSMLGTPAKQPIDTFRRMYTLSGEDWQRGLALPNVHSAAASALGLVAPPKEFSLSQDQFNDLDSWSRTQLGVSSTLNFFHSAMSELTKNMTKNIDSLLLADESSDLKGILAQLRDSSERVSTLDTQMRRVIFNSAAIAAHQFLSLTLVNRDRYLSQLPDTVSPETVLELRTAPIIGQDLLDPGLLATAAKQVADKQQTLIRQDMERVAHNNLKRCAGNNPKGIPNPKNAKRGATVSKQSPADTLKLEGQLKSIQKALASLKNNKSSGQAEGAKMSNKSSKSKKGWTKGKQGAKGKASSSKQA